MNPKFLGFDAVGRKITITPKERKTHMHVIGASDSGKSRFLEWMIRGDLHSRQGFCLIDPHGELYDEVVEYCAHHVLDREIILLNLAEGDQIVGFNPFRKLPDADVSVQVDRRIAATFRAWNVRTGDDTPTLERTLRLIYTVMIERNLGLNEVRHLINFDAHEICSHLVEQLQTALIQEEWEQLLELKRKEWQDEVLSAKNRLFRLLTSPTLARFMGLPGRTIDVCDIIENQKVLLVNVAASDTFSEANRRVFGAWLVNEFFETAKRRKKDAFGNDPSPYFLYIDEFQKFVALDLADMLDEVRKRGLYAVLAHQRFGQLDKNITDAILTNCRIKAVFGGLPVESARLMAEELFIGELDRMRVKVAIYQTKFWPIYERDRVFTEGSARGSRHSVGEQTSSGSSEGFASGNQWAQASSHGIGSSSFFQPGDWFADGGVAGNGFSESHGSSEMAGTSSFQNTGSFEMSGTNVTDAESETESYAVADIPIFVPVPFKELSSVQYYSQEEQVTELTAALKEQYQRHCFIKIREQKTQPMLVPFVERFYTPESNREWYRQKLLKTQGALPVSEVDRLLEERQRALLDDIRAREALPEDFHE